MALRLSSSELYDMAEAYYGATIAPEEMMKAEPYARRKLTLINEREGTDHGDDYLAILIAETVKQNAISAFTFALCNLIMGDAESSTGQENGIKKNRTKKRGPKPVCHFTTPTNRNQ